MEAKLTLYDDDFALTEEVGGYDSEESAGMQSYASEFSEHL